MARFAVTPRQCAPCRTSQRPALLGCSRAAILSASLASIILLAGPLIGAAQNSPQPHPSESTELHSIRSSSARLSEISAFEQYVVYWTTEPGWRTQLQLRNNLESSELTVTPALRTQDGAETALPAVTIKPGEVVSVDLSDALLKAAPQLVGGWGSLVLRYRANVHRALNAAVLVRLDQRLSPSI